MSWAPGTSIVYQEIWGEQLLVARPVTVVEDEDGLLALYTHPRVRYRSAAMGTERYQKTLEERISVMISDDRRVYEERVGSDSHVLVLAQEGRWNAVWLFWRADWEHVCWYINLQEPIRRTSRGVEIRDCALDLVVHPDRSWEWKDRDEFEGLCAHGFFPPKVAERVEAEAMRISGMVENWESPFCDSWEAWRPSSSWSAPELASDWHVLDR